MKMTETALITLFQLFGKYLFQGWGFSGTCEQRVRLSSLSFFSDSLSSFFFSFVYVELFIYFIDF